MNNILVTGGGGFIGSNLALALQEKFPEASLTVLDDFRSGDFRNLQGYRGDLVGGDASRLDWNEQFKNVQFDAIFHEASITDTTEHNQLLQIHDNVEGFRRLLEFALKHQTPVVYASSAATYGIASTIMREDQTPAPANVYAFTKVQLDNLARGYWKRNPQWRIVGVRYFNVYGPHEAHKGAAASMIYQLYRQMKAGKQPRVFTPGDQKRDFVYVKDVVAMTIRAATSPLNGIFNCGSGHAFSFNQVISELNRNLNSQLEPDYFENPYAFYQPHTEADMTLAREQLQFTPTFAPADGIADYVQWLEANSNAKNA